MMKRGCTRGRTDTRLPKRTWQPRSNARDRPVSAQSMALTPIARSLSGGHPSPSTATNVRSLISSPRHLPFLLLMLPRLSRTCPLARLSRSTKPLSYLRHRSPQRNRRRRHRTLRTPRLLTGETHPTVLNMRTTPHRATHISRRGRHSLNDTSTRRLPYRPFA